MREEQQTRFDEVTKTPEALAEFICKHDFRCELKCSSCVYGEDPTVSACGAFWDKNQCQEGIAEWLKAPADLNK